MNQRPTPDEYAPYYGNYISKVAETDIVAAMKAEAVATDAFLRAVPPDQADRLHPPYTWSFRQVVSHLIEAERIFAYRALRFARGDSTPLPGFDENAYANATDLGHRPLDSLAAEWHALRQSHILMFEHLPPAAWDRRGTASNSPFSVRALAYAIVGHERHHMQILNTRLGVRLS